MMMFNRKSTVDGVATLSPYNFFLSNKVDVIDSVFQLCQSDSLYGKALKHALDGKYASLSSTERMALHARAAMIAVKYDKNNAIWHVKRARHYFLSTKVSENKPMDVVMFYGVYAWACIYFNVPSQCLVALRSMDRIVVTCIPQFNTVSIRLKRLLSVVCNLTSGSPVSISEELVESLKYYPRVSYHQLLGVIHNAFESTRRPVSRRFVKFKYLGRRVLVSDLYGVIVTEYKSLPAPLCGAYERGNPGKYTECVNEFLVVFTTEPRRHVVTEADLNELEMKYGVTFNRNNLKFIVR